MVWMVGKDFDKMFGLPDNFKAPGMIRRLADEDEDPEPVKSSVRYSHLPCEDIICLRKDVDIILKQTLPDLNQLKGNESEIKETLRIMNVDLNGTIDRIFELFKKHDGEIDNLKEKNIRQDALVGVSDKESDKREREVDDLNKTRQPILDRLTKVESNKSDKDDVHKIIIAVEKVGIKIDDHVQHEHEIDVDDEDRRHDEDVKKQWHMERVDKWLIAIIGIIISFVGVVNILSVWFK